MPDQGRGGEKELKGKQQFTCIVCPLGCLVQVVEGPEGTAVSGHECSRGEKYALQELADPRRVLTGTVRVTGGFLPRLPVKSSAPIPKKLIMEASRALSRINAVAPLRCGDIIAENFAGSGADLISTRDLPRESGERKI